MSIKIACEAVEKKKCLANTITVDEVAVVFYASASNCSNSFSFTRITATEE